MSSKKGDPQLSAISSKLDTLIRLSALNLVRDTKTQREQIALLSDAGFQPKEIADILIISRIQVNTVIYQIRRERGGKEEGEKKEQTEATEVQQEVEKSAQETGATTTS
jgi:wobble nucleotide-excising tRNase